MLKKTCYIRTSNIEIKETLHLKNIFKKSRYLENILKTFDFFVSLSFDFETISSRFCITTIQDIRRVLRKKRFRLVVRLGVDNRAPGLDVGGVLDDEIGIESAQALHQRACRLSETPEFVGYDVYDLRFRCRRTNGTDGVATHGDRLVELAPAERTQHVQAHAYRAGTVAVDNDVVGRAVKVLDVSFYPIEGGDLIEYTVIAGRLGVCRREESQDV